MSDRDQRTNPPSSCGCRVETSMVEACAECRGRVDMHYPPPASKGLDAPYRVEYHTFACSRHHLNRRAS